MGSFPFVFFRVGAAAREKKKEKEKNTCPEFRGIGRAGLLGFFLHFPRFVTKRAKTRHVGRCVCVRGFVAGYSQINRFRLFFSGDGRKEDCEKNEAK